MQIKTLGIDLGKNCSSIHGVDENGKVVIKKKVSRSELSKFVANLNTCQIGMEACGGSHYWARMFKELGHEVKLIAGQFVKPFVKSNKNDDIDAEAITEAMIRPNMRFVAIKNVEHQDIQCLHRIRERLVKNRTSLINEMRSFLMEYGITLPQGRKKFMSQFQIEIDKYEDKLSDLMKAEIQILWTELKDIFNRCESIEKKLEHIGKSSELCKLMTTVPGVGMLTATALLSAIGGNASMFKNGRHMSAWLGLVPKQFSTGGKIKLLGISKRGDKYLRKLLIHGSRSVLSHTKHRSCWLENLALKKGAMKAVVAQANKNCRILWSVLKHRKPYDSCLV